MRCMSDVCGVMSWCPDSSHLPYGIPAWWIADMVCCGLYCWWSVGYVVLSWVMSLSWKHIAFYGFAKAYLLRSKRCSFSLQRPCFGVPFAVFCKAGCFCCAGIRPAPLLLRISQLSTFHAISPLPYINYAVALLFFILPARKKNKFSIFVKKYPVRVMVRLPPLYAPRRWVS